MLGPTPPDHIGVLTNKMLPADDDDDGYYHGDHHNDDDGDNDKDEDWKVLPESRKTDRDDVLLEDNVSGESEDGKEILMLTKIVINDGNGHANQYIDGNCVKTN